MHSNAHLDALTANLTRETFRRVLAYARRRCRLLHLTDPDLPDHLVADVVADTYVGTLTWIPNRCSLVTHLCGAVRHRSWQLHLRGRRHVDLEAVEGVLQATSDAEPDARVLAGEVARALFDQAPAAANDNVARDVFAAFADGEPTRRAVAERVGITARQVDAALHRLRRTVATMPEPIRDALRECLHRG